MRKYITLVIVLLIVFLITKNEEYEDKKIKEESKTSEEQKEQLVNVFYNNENFTINLEDYIIGVLACEMPASFNEEALKAGAVAIRTFYMYKNISIEEYMASNNDQCYNTVDDMKNKWGESYDKYYNKIKGAVEETKDEYILYNDEIIESFYFSMSNGYTENIEDVFSSPLPYLVSVESSWDKNISTFEKETEMSKEDFLAKLSLDNSDDIDIEVISYTSGNRINIIHINNTEFKGTEVRKLLKLRSADFDIVVENKVKITTRGYGHGVGMSQYGANEMAKEGYNYKDILKHYYKGTEISKI